MDYRLVAIDLDGTLLLPDQTVPADTVAAIEAVEAAGAQVCLATGRALNEALPAWKQLRLAAPFLPMVVQGGAMVSEPDTGRTLWNRLLDAETAQQFAEAFAEAGHSTIAAVDHWRCGLDYHFVESADAEAVQRCWFGKLGLAFRRVSRLDGDPAAARPLRVVAACEPDEALELAAKLRARFDGVATVRALRAPNLGVTLVEAFAAGVDKFHGVTYIAQSRRIGRGQVVAIGDDVNDLGMLRGAGLGVAMPAATEEVRQAADMVAEDGLAAILHRLAAGELDG